MKTPKYVRELLAKYKNDVIKLDLGCSSVKQEGFIGIDMKKYKGVDIVHDLEQFPFPLPSNCATLVMASHIVEHINPHKGTFIKFMNEVWRVTKYEGQFFIAVPYAGSRGYWADPTHCNPCNMDTWGYFTPSNPLLYGIYRPLPWKIDKLTFQVNGNMEVILVKNRIDPSFRCLYTAENEEKEDE